jgi:hypothetical protein
MVCNVPVQVHEGVPMLLVIAHAQIKESLITSGHQGNAPSTWLVISQKTSISARDVEQYIHDKPMRNHRFPLHLSISNVALWQPKMACIEPGYSIFSTDHLHAETLPPLKYVFKESESMAT